MFRRYAFPLALLLLILPPLSTSARAQSGDRARLSTEIDSLREQLKLKEREFLAPAVEDRAAFAEFLREPETGLIRLLPREKYQKRLTTVGGGAYYSFSRRTHEYGRGSDLELEQNQLSVGFAGADFGYLLLLGDMPLEDVIAETDGVPFLASLVSPSREPDARTEQQHASRGIKHEGFNYQSRLPVQVGKTYVLRSVNYNESDTLVAFRVVRQDADDSVIILWKLLKKFPKPQLMN
jgi:hypothetical protein